MALLVGLTPSASTPGVLAPPAPSPAPFPCLLSPDVPAPNWHIVDDATLFIFTLSDTVEGMKSLWSTIPILVAGGVATFGCGSTPTIPTSGKLGVQVTSVAATLEPYNPQISNHGIPAEQVNFTVSGLPKSSATSYFHCSVRVFHSGRQVGATSVVSGASPRQSVSVEVRGRNFAGKPSDAHVRCHLSTSPLLR